MINGDGDEIYPLICKETSRGHRVCKHCGIKMGPGTECVKILGNGSICPKCFFKVFVKVAGHEGLRLLDKDISAEWALEEL